MTTIHIQSIEEWFNSTAISPLLIAGPCSVESPEQMLETAQKIKKYAPVSLLRGGVWKPRTQPGSFEGIGGLLMKLISTIFPRIDLFTQSSWIAQTPSFHDVQTILVQFIIYFPLMLIMALIDFEKNNF